MQASHIKVDLAFMGLAINQNTDRHNVICRYVMNEFTSGKDKSSWISHHSLNRYNLEADPSDKREDANNHELVK